MAGNDSVIIIWTMTDWKKNLTIMLMKRALARRSHKYAEFDSHTDITQVTGFSSTEDQSLNGADVWQKYIENTNFSTVNTYLTDDQRVVRQATNASNHKTKITNKKRHNPIAGGVLTTTFGASKTAGRQAGHEILTMLPQTDYAMNYRQILYVAICWLCMHKLMKWIKTASTAVKTKKNLSRAVSCTVVT
jgi:hypothetical protein